MRLIDIGLDFNTILRMLIIIFFILRFSEFSQCGILDFFLGARILGKFIMMWICWELGLLNLLAIIRGIINFRRDRGKIKVSYLINSGFLI
jgi:hypothetical protein